MLKYRTFLVGNRKINVPLTDYYNNHKDKIEISLYALKKRLTRVYKNEINSVIFVSQHSSIFKKKPRKQRIISFLVVRSITDANSKQKVSLEIITKHKIDELTDEVCRIKPKELQCSYDRGETWWNVRKQTPVINNVSYWNQGRKERV